MEDRLKDFKEISNEYCLRAFNKEDKKFYYLKLSEKCFNMGFGVYGWVADDGISYPIQSILQCPKMWEAPQKPTGLKDKNGKLIYEGDIVKTKVLNDFTQFGQNQQWLNIQREIIFDAGGFFLDDCDNPIFLGQLPGNYLEIIGNIFENKELFEVPA